MNLELLDLEIKWTSRPEEVLALTCHCCAQVLRNPQRLPCGHSVCICCVTDVQLTCPECGKKFDKKTVSKDILAFNLIEELMLQCPQQDCNWKGRYDDFKGHYRQKHVLQSINLPKELSEVKENDLPSLHEKIPGASKKRARVASPSRSPPQVHPSRPARSSIRGRNSAGKLSNRIPVNSNPANYVNLQVESIFSDIAPPQTPPTDQNPTEISQPSQDSQSFSIVELLSQVLTVMSQFFGS